ncbi:PepSY domain-containing protein [Frankia sp. Mgl5]|uniref:PepSY domain-containing protein n=1 Tax=Frankia sp. Mgl5 TaxID=2933793 RepID=UPI00200E62AF|nr:PepSY domain-containing protein [Frankia sp. Mgl5]MCK9925876.1 PepSY domain-containing protein [Frankia sp. Mgl5]
MDKVDRIIAAARGAGLDGPVEITPPAGAGTAWTVAQTDRRWPVRLDQMAVDPADARVVNEVRGESWPLLAQLTRIGIAAHMGELFGVANQILLASLAVDLVLITAAVGWALPVLGVTLLAFLALDATAGLVRGRRRQRTDGTPAQPA